MTANRRDPREQWLGASAKTVMIFAVIWLGEAFFILIFCKWVFHTSAVLYLLMIPWSLLGWILAVRPNWFIRMSKATENRLNRDLERMEKWNPPGFT
jgi:hypothetical protein